MPDLQPVVFLDQPIVVTLVNDSGSIIVSMPDTTPVIETPIETIVVIDVSTPPEAETIIVELSSETVIITPPVVETVVVLESSEIVVVLEGSGSQGAVYFPSAYTGNLDASDFVFALTAPIGFYLPAGLTGSVARVRVAPTGTAVLPIQKTTAGVTAVIGTITFNSGVTAGVFALATRTTFAAGDLLEILAPPVYDPTLADLRISIAAVPAS